MRLLGANSIDDLGMQHVCVLMPYLRHEISAWVE
jgi:hypothetical protein